MTRRLCSFLILVGILAGTLVQPTTTVMSQNKPPVAQDPSGRMTASPPVLPDSPVLTVEGLCPSKTVPGINATCQTVVTRAQFEKLADAVEPENTPEAKLQLANAYGQFLVMAQEAHKRKLDENPRFEERLAFARLQILSQQLVRQIQVDAAQVPDEDIAAYYQAHLSDFEEISVERIVVPNQKRVKAEPHGEGISRPNGAADEMTKEANALRARAAAGEDFGKLQMDAYDFAGVSGASSPQPNLGKLRRRGLPPAHAPVFELQPGQVSQVITDATGHYIYKADSRETLPLATVKPEIGNILKQQRIQRTMEEIRRPFKTEVNHAYFVTGADTSSD
jgi:parvulin-like peptidyl-prolyl cis-trans isomerase-like protein